jgi:hypothetical protein
VSTGKKLYLQFENLTRIINQIGELMNELTTTPDLLTPEMISPEGLSIAEAYLANGSDTRKTAVALGLDVAVVDAQLKNREVSSYIDKVFYETGFRNRDRLFGVLDQVINLKLAEMEETGMGSNEDILTLVTKMHAMKMAEMKMVAEIAKAKQATAPTTQTNVQINTIPGSSDPGYMDVLNLLTNPGGRK